MTSKCFDVPKFHENLWHEFADGSPECASLASLGSTKVAGFDRFLVELHHRLYSESPHALPAGSAVRGKLHDLVSDLPEFEPLRSRTRRDPVAAGQATCTLAHTIVRSLPTRPSTPDADRARDLLEGLQILSDSSVGASKALAERLANAKKLVNTAERAEAVQASTLDETAIRQALRTGIEATRRAINDAESVLFSFGWGSHVGESASSKPPGVAIELARRVASSDKLKKIVELAGRLTLTARAKRASRNQYLRSEIVGVEQTGDIGRILPTELVSLSSPLQTAALYRRLLERSALGYKMSGKAKLARGPVILCIDQSGSMQMGGKDEWAKAIALAILDTARAEHRAFGLILYDEGIHSAKMFPVAANADPREILTMLSYVPDGGTNYAPALSLALDWIAMGGRFKQSDLIHITDGNASTADAPATRARAKFLGAQIFGIGIGIQGGSLSAWSDETSFINDIGNDTPAVDLIFDSI